MQVLRQRSGDPGSLTSSTVTRYSPPSGVAGDLTAAAQRLVLLGDTLDFLRVPVPGALFARNDAEAVGQLARIAAAHPTVFEALSATVNDGTAIDVVVGKRHVELARSAVQRRLRTLLKAAGDPAADQEAVRFHLWGYYVPGLLYAEHGDHDINTFRRRLVPFREGRTEPAAGGSTGVGSATAAWAGRPSPPPLRQIVGDLFSVRRGNIATACCLDMPRRLGFRSQRFAGWTRWAGPQWRPPRHGSLELVWRAAHHSGTPLRRSRRPFMGCWRRLAAQFRFACWSHPCRVPSTAARRGWPVPEHGIWSTDYRRAVNGGQPVPDPPRRT